MPQARLRTGGSRISNNVQQKGEFFGAVSRFWQRSYVADYVGFAILLTAYLLILLVIEPFHRMFSLDNLAIQFPHASVERVSVAWNIVYAGVVPFLLLCLWVVVFQPGLHKAHVTILGLFISLILTSFITDVIKNSVGRPRPDLIARCKPKKGTPEHGLITVEVCSETNHHVLHDGWRSFPSGHSSFAFAGLGYLALVFAGQMHVFRPHADLARALVALVPLLGAAMIAISRCEDYRHDVYDVTTGSLLGILMALFSYRKYYPGLTTVNCDRPYPSHSELVSSNTFGRLKDEEAQVSGANGFVRDGFDEELEYVPLQPFLDADGDAGMLIGSNSESRPR